jgi:hypothetical protein
MGYAQSKKGVVSALLRVRYKQNSLDSLRRSLVLGRNLRILGTIYRICRSQQKNSLLNSLLQGIGTPRKAARLAQF